jgi:hypothetical protein
MIFIEITAWKILDSSPGAVAHRAMTDPLAVARS